MVWELNLINDSDEHALSLLTRGHLLGGEKLESKGEDSVSSSRIRRPASWLVLD